MTNRARSFLIAGGLVVLLVVIGIVASQSGSDDDGGGGSGVDDTAELEALFDGIPQSGLVVGDPDAPVRVVEFGDLQCPFCAQFAETVPDVIERYVRTGQISLEFAPLHFIGPDSEALARLVGAASLQDRAWPLLEVLYARQGPENSGYATEDFLREAAEAVPGLDVEQALADADSQEVTDILSDAQARAEEFGVDSTPSFFWAPSGRDRFQRLDVPSLDIGGFADAIEPVLSRASG
ncbi:MAG TPA: thioredoxin domain-containing protein [Solirubrobacterales bacterium]|jgi:protein-disulfide isomerase